MIFLDHGTTGDGVLTGLMLAARVAETGQPLAELATVMRRLPQVLINVKGVDKARVETDGELPAAVRPRRALAGTGRVLLRNSGTEPVVRVMVEAGSGAGPGRGRPPGRSGQGAPRALTAPPHRGRGMPGGHHPAYPSVFVTPLSGLGTKGCFTPGTVVG